MDRSSWSVRQRPWPRAAFGLVELTLPISLSRVFASGATSALRNLSPLCRVTRTETFIVRNTHKREKKGEVGGGLYSDPRYTYNKRPRHFFCFKPTEILPMGDRLGSAAAVPGQVFHTRTYVTGQFIKKGGETCLGR